MGTIYLILNKMRYKRYVGQTWETLQTRWSRHKYKALHGDTSCRHLYAALRKEGADAFEVHVLATADTQPELDALEIHWIDLLQSANRDSGYNLKSGGSAGRHTTETRQRMSKTRKGHANAGAFPKGVLSSSSPFPQGHVSWNKQSDRKS